MAHDAKKAAGGSPAKAGPSSGSGLAAILSDSRILYGLIAVFFIFYLLSGSFIFGVLIGLCIIGLVAFEFLEGAKQHGVKSEIRETAIALLLALVVWFGAGFILQTPSPLNAIVSCSMLPHVQRGDMVVLQGGPISAPEESIPTVAGIMAADIYENGALAQEVQGSIYSYCSLHQPEALCQRFISSPERFTERHGALTFGYGTCETVYPKTGQKQSGPCVQWLEVNNKRYSENISNSVVVYAPPSDQLYSRVGDIIHRAFLTLRAQDSGKSYVLTKGDNNPIFDMQVYDEPLGMGNLPAESSTLKGRVILSVPYAGYLKLFISPAAIATPDGCDRQYAKWG